MAAPSPLPGDNQVGLAHDDDDAHLDHDDDHEFAPYPGASSISDPKHLQKRRRVTRACDECRRKKIKCDGKQPCTHCTVYSYECTYDQPSNRRRNPAPQYVEALENRLHKAEALIRVVLPEINLDDPQFDLHATEQMLAAAKKDKLQQSQPPLQQPAQGSQQYQSPSMAPRSSSAATQPQPAAPLESADDSMLETMVDSAGCLDLDDQGHWDYHGHTSGVIFLRRLRKQLGASDMQAPAIRSRPVPSMLDSPRSVGDSPQDSLLPPTHDLPSRPVARRLCHNAFEDGCSLMRFIHEPTFYATLDRIYDTPAEQYGNDENSFLPLLYIVMSVGCLFSDDGAGTLDVSGYESAIGQGFQFFKAGRQLLEITDCRDLTSLQAICFMVLFLQSSAKLSTCYSYVGIALRSALRLGLHRSVTADFNPIERELRKRIFWVIRKMDVYVSTLLGLPQMLSDDDIDQEYPLDVDADYITANGIMPMPPDRTPLMAGSNAHTRLANIMMKLVRYIYPVKNAQYRSESDHRYVVSHAKIREIERDLQSWMEGLPAALRPGMEVSPQLERIRQLLRIGYAHAQMVMYRPFLHYVSSGSQARGVDKRSYACAAACVSVSRNIVHITTGMQKRGLLNGSYWFTMYTTYFAILSLIFFVLENPDSPTAKDGVLKDAMEGKNTLAGLAKKSLAADRCSQSLNSLFKNLPELLKNRQSSVAPVNLKRPAPSNKPANVKGPSALPEMPPPLRASTTPHQLMARSHRAEARPKSLDDSQARRGHSRSRSDVPTNVSTPRWVPSTPDSATETTNPTTPSETYNSSSFSNTPSPLQSAPRQDISAFPFPQQVPGFDNNVPDLMPIMFPSDDPFAYPTQPMSTLEDDHFRNEGSSGPFSFDQRATMPTTTGAPNAMGLTNSPSDNLANLSLFNDGTSTRMSPVMPNRFSGHQQSGQTRLQSPRSGMSTPGEQVSSPDLVSIPNQNFMWQGYNFQPPNWPTGELSAQQQQQQQSQKPQQQPQQQPPQQQQQQQQQSQFPPTHGLPSFGMGVEENNPTGIGIDLGIQLDDLLGSNEAYRPAGNYNNDDWLQWMNVGN